MIKTEDLRRKDPRQKKLLKIVGGLEYIGALGKSGDELENYLDEIIRLGF